MTTRIQKAIESVETQKASHDAARKAAEFAGSAFRRDRTPQARAAHVEAQRTLDAAQKPMVAAWSELADALTEAGHAVDDLTGCEQLAMAKAL